MRVYILMAMICCHIVEDFGIQGILSKFKQKSFWYEYDFKYHNDWFISLLEHAFENSFLMMLPIAIYYRFNITDEFIFWFICNFIFHAIIDHWKCNKLQINLLTDQCLHLMWIVLTWHSLVIV